MNNSMIENRTNRNLSFRTNKQNQTQCSTTRQKHNKSISISNQNSRIQKCSRIDTSPVGKSRTLKVCQNHKNKTAKYRIVSDEETIHYCEKCSIFLASQGFGVEKLEVEGQAQIPTGNAGMKNELEVHIDSVLKNLEAKEQTIKKKVFEIQQYEKHLKEEVEKYFSKIIEFIVEKKKEFKRVVEAQQKRQLRKQKQYELQIQRAMIQVMQIKEQTNNQAFTFSDRAFIKTQIKKFRIMCQRLEVVEPQKNYQMITSDLDQVFQSISDCINMTFEPIGNRKQQFSFEETQISKVKTSFGSSEKMKNSLFSQQYF